MNWLVISDLKNAPRLFRQGEVTHAISFRDNTFEHPKLDLPEDRWLKFSVPDAVWTPRADQYKAVTGYMKQIVAWARALPMDAKIGVNCLMGQSRSTAAALIVAIAREGFEDGIKTWWCSCDFLPSPNMMFIEIGDKLLGLEYQLVEYVENIGEKYMTERVRPVGAALIQPGKVDDETEALLREYGLDKD